MIPRVLLIVTSDPRESHRPAEAIRIAAGVGAWKRAEVSLYLRGAAVLALSEFPDELVEEDNFTRYLPVLAEGGRPVFVEAGAAFLGELGEPVLETEEIDEEGLARMVAESDFVARF